MRNSYLMIGRMHVGGITMAWTVSQRANRGHDVLLVKQTLIFVSFTFVENGYV